MNPVFSKSVEIIQEEDRKILLEQYKMLLDSINKINELRETANNFWIGINGAFIGIIAYVRDSSTIGGDQKTIFLYTIILLGFILTSFWLSSLITVKNNIETKNKMLVDLEKYFPAKIFTPTMDKATGKQENWSTIVFNEMFVPLTFLISYFFFGIFLYTVPRAIVPLVNQ